MIAYGLKLFYFMGRDESLHKKVKSLTFSTFDSVLAGLTDLFDGLLARRLQAYSKLGRILDPLADKLLLTTLYILFGLIGLIPLWLTVLVVGRDIAITLTYLLLKLLKYTIKITPLLSSKINTASQMILITYILCITVFDVSITWLTQFGIYAVTATTLWSWGDYFIAGIKNNER